ncbi:MAG: GNAT family N-acetyltransferase [Anaerolineae bacterium]|nr:GNAT family N-acetyltransferase [Anaerolineae bacterium]
MKSYTNFTQQTTIPDDWSVIRSPRLDLISLTPAFLRLTLDRDRAGAEQWLGLSIPAEWFDKQWLVELRYQQLQQDPAYQPWCLRAIGLRETGDMAGYIGFHARPGEAYLREFAPNGVEFGYTVFAPFRRQGYAREACAALMQWACEEQQVCEFVVTISPDNVASTRLAQGFGFQQIGSHIDDQDGLEYIYRVDYPQTGVTLSV